MGGGYRGQRTSFAARRAGAPSAPRQGKGPSLDEYSGSIKPRVFISFHVEDEAQVNLLRHQSKNSDRMEFTDYSVKEPFDEKWKTQCTERIKRSSVVVVVIGEDTHTRPAVLWEIKKAHELGKPVIGVRIYNNQTHKIPAPMVEHGDRIIPWNLDTIQGELDQVIAERERS